MSSLMLTSRNISESSVTASDLLAVPRASRTEAGFRRNVRVGVQYIEAWLRGIGAVPLYDLMEDAATAEISRAQVWQWITHAAALNHGRLPTIEWLRQVLGEELDVVRAEVGESRFASGRFAEASEIFFDVATSNPLREFFTTAAYERI
jgi:malate synthase